MNHQKWPQGQDLPRAKVIFCNTDTDPCVTWSSINVSLHSSFLARSFQFLFPKSTKRLVQWFANKLAALAGLHMGTLYKSPAHVFELITNYIGSQRNWLQCVHMDTNDGLSIPPVLPCHREFIITSAKDQQQNTDKTIFFFTIILCADAGWHCNALKLRPFLGVCE